MRAYIAGLVILVVHTGAAVAQSGCRLTQGQIIERGPAFTIQRVSLRTGSGRLLDAKAVIPDIPSPTGATVFSFSALSDVATQRTVDMMPVATELAKRKQASIVIQRNLSWPTVDSSVGTMSASVLCAEQWLSAHASVQADNWRFVGPRLDVPSFEQLHALGDSTSMTFYRILPIGGPNENIDTQGVLRDSSWLALPN